MSSVYLWDLEDGGFAGVALLKKAMVPTSPDEPSDSWDSIHILETAECGRRVPYKLTSTVMLELVTKQNNKADKASVLVEPAKMVPEQGWKSSGEITLRGSMTRQISSPVLTTPSFEYSMTMTMFNVIRMHRY
ncbi:F-actin-capping protein subunit beta [Suillus clintonianus]|uniref:F-actin-capping protein subunit beta n=1 Tax=Suillus clintonianus TaxID=1904413 RepID=UPI001B878B05|nr:F-actin-capping protein subunit beta [Suillus clintonianus]KAG2132060.1 F-actin-capping protein subunit beta [Suillus clintonianus]